MRRVVSAGMGVCPSVLYMRLSAVLASAVSSLSLKLHLDSICCPSVLMLEVVRRLGGYLPGLGLPPPSRRGLVLWPMVTMISKVGGGHALMVSMALSGVIPVRR